MGLGATGWHRRHESCKSSCKERLLGRLFTRVSSWSRGKLLEQGHRDGTHCLTAFCGHPGSRSTMGSGHPVLEQSSTPAELMMGKRKARKEEALPRAHAGRMQRVIPGTEVAVSTAVTEAQPDLLNHRELQHLSNLPAHRACYPCSIRAMPSGKSTPMMDKRRRTRMDLSLDTEFRLCFIPSPVQDGAIYPKELLQHPKRADFSLQSFRHA